jgi:hypothetical protein
MVWVALSTSDVCVALFAGATRSVCVAAYYSTGGTLLWAACAVEAVSLLCGMWVGCCGILWVERTIEIGSLHR